jgi:hypothetical protein
MAEDAKRQDQLLETTDCLEAVGTLKFNKNLFFFIIFFCLLILQGIFWMTPTEYVERPGGDWQKGLMSAAEASLEAAEGGISALSVSAEKSVKVESKGEKIEKAAQELTTDANIYIQAAKPSATTSEKIGLPVNIKFQFSQLAWMIRLCNFLLIVCSVIYSLTLLFCMKVSLDGRLGGIRHITKAVLISFFMVVLILPWQLLFKDVIVGVIYTPAELLEAWNGYDKTVSVSSIIMFLRFTGLWLAVLVLLFWAQHKSMRWSRNTLKRLGIIA